MYPTSYDGSSENGAHDNTWSYESISLQNPAEYSGYIDAGQNTWNSIVNPATGETYFETKQKVGYLKMEKTYL